MTQAELEERFDAVVKRIESKLESRAIFAACKASECGPMCLGCSSKNRRIAELESQLAACRNRVARGLPTTIGDPATREGSGQWNRQTGGNERPLVRTQQAARKADGRAAIFEGEKHDENPGRQRQDQSAGRGDRAAHRQTWGPLDTVGGGLHAQAASMDQGFSDAILAPGAGRENRADLESEGEMKTLGTFGR